MLWFKIINLSLIFLLLFTTIVQPIIVMAESLEETIPQLKLSLAKTNKSEESHDITIDKNEKGTYVRAYNILCKFQNGIIK